MSAAHPLGELAFEGCRVPAAAVIGEVGAGFKLGMATLDQLRPTVGAAACGMARRALDEALAHALARTQFGKPLADFQIVQDKLGRMAIELDAARLLVYRAAWEKDRGAERITTEAAMAKAYATEAAQRVDRPGGADPGRAGRARRGRGGPAVPLDPGAPDLRGDDGDPAPHRRRTDPGRGEGRREAGA